VDKMDLKDFNIDQHFSYEELLAYQQARLSNKEMHRLEVHLVDCELCNDALEGVGLIQENVLEKHLSSLKVKSGVHRSGSISTKQWLTMAASLSLIAIVSIIYFGRPVKNELIAEKSISEETKQKPVLESEAAAQLKNDSIINPLQVDGDLLVTTDSTTPAEQQIIASPVAKAETQTIETDTSTGAISLAFTEIDSSELLIAELVVDETDSTDLILLADTETISEEDDLSPSSSRMATGAEKQVDEPMEASSKKSLTVDDYIPAEPKQGIRSYNRYLKRRMNYPQAASENNIEGEVILEVTIDSNGEIGQIEITKALGFGCDQEAIRLVREGPIWQTATRNGNAILEKVIITVPFNP